MWSDKRESCQLSAKRKGRYNIPEAWVMRCANSQTDPGLKMNSPPNWVRSPGGLTGILKRAFCKSSVSLVQSHCYKRRDLQRYHERVDQAQHVDDTLLDLSRNDPRVLSSVHLLSCYVDGSVLNA